MVGISKPGINTSGKGMPAANGGGNFVLVILILVWKGLWWIWIGLWPGLWDDKISETKKNILLQFLKSEISRKKEKYEFKINIYWHNGKVRG